MAVLLSDSTEAYDRGDKFADYQILDSLEEYVLINTKRQRVECFRRGNDGLWILQSYTDRDTTFTLHSLGYTGNLATLYENVTFPLPSDPENQLDRLAGFSR